MCIPVWQQDDDFGDLVAAIRVNHIEELRDMIQRLHGGHATHVTSVPVKEMLQGRTLWEGVVEIFDLSDHPKAKTAYAWANKSDDVLRSNRHMAVLHIHPVTSPELAVRAAIRQEFSSLESTD